MPEVSFYILPSDSEIERFRFVCKLAEKGFRAEKKIYILTDSEKQNQNLDDLLWTFRAGSFIPHEIDSNLAVKAETAVLIGSSNVPENWQQTIINISQHGPDSLEHTHRILEILDNDKVTKQAGRQRYRQYQQSNLTINTYNI